jgi:hypothetical protein
MVKCCAEGCMWTWSNSVQCSKKFTFDLDSLHSTVHATKAKQEYLILFFIKRETTKSFVSSMCS